MSNEIAGAEFTESARVNIANALVCKRGKKRWILLSTALSGLLVSGLLFITNVSTSLSVVDVTSLESEALNLDELPRPVNYDDEIRTIRIVQSRLFAKVPFGQGIPDYEPREPTALLKYGRGMCYDRSRTLEKAYTYLGFKVRHVFLLYRKESSLFSALLSRGHPSHAVTEVKTSRGWLYVDSNLPWIAINRAGDPVGAGGIWKQFDQLENAPEYVRGPWWAIRGLYSRKGAFYEPFFPLPQLNWKDFAVWIVEKAGDNIRLWSANDKLESPLTNDRQTN